MFLIKNSKAKKITFKAAAIAVFCFVVVSVINQRVQVEIKKQELDHIQTEISTQKIKNQNLNKALDAAVQKDQHYLEGIAREVLDYKKENERVFINISGN